MKESAFTALYKEFYVRLYLDAWFFLHDEEVCKDIVHDVFAQLWVKWETIDMDHPKTYLKTAVKNACINRVRHNKYVIQHQRDSMLLPEPAAYGDTLEHKELGARLRKAILSLPLGQQRVFILRYVAGLSQKEAARVIGRNAQTVKIQLSRAIKVLRGQLKTA